MLHKYLVIVNGHRLLYTQKPFQESLQETDILEKYALDCLPFPFTILNNKDVKVQAGGLLLFSVNS